ncbi:outer membrane beta-barrel protein [Hymenobacter sediminicola]|uniref:Outer membrane beta-barrel protein n=1 Tax=Hymenobacter sediminicola TaxID=2761579 RepID=A0A7G7W746_9BACT|nr:outer membrane beta-barrel protein [Hymenobacter sediminicola]QNH62189.1 outer membrane beta-barrel protein [Hymenobacter sediminicola]
MRHYLFGLVAALATTTAAQAQISAGTVLLGGNLGYRQQKAKVGATNFRPAYEDRLRQISISPTAGYFVADNLVVGVQLNWQRDAHKYPAIVPVVINPGPGPATADVLYGESTMRRLQVGPFARYYKFIGSKAAFYGQLGAGYSVTNYEDEPPVYIGNSDTKISGFYGQLSPGVVYFPTPLFALAVSLRGLTYQHFAYSGEGYGSNDRTSSIFDAGFRLRDLRLGASFYLGRGSSL